MTRYARQTILPEIGRAGQDALSDSHILVVGAGGLGCPALQYLAGAGIGRITIADGDTVAMSNLHRQILFREDQVGQFKAEAAARTLSGLNSEIEITAITQAVTPANADTLVAETDLVLDCADSFAASYILSDDCFAQGKPFITASALGLTGYAGGFCGGAPSLRAVFPDLPDRAANCATAGVLGPVVGLIGAAQAQMALAVLAKIEPNPLGHLVSFDLKTFRQSSFRFDTAPEPDMRLGFISANQIRTNDFVVELRGTDEAPNPVTRAAARLTVADVKSQNPVPAPGQRAVLTCRSGLRAWQAATHLQTYWDGPISLIAMGDTPELERQS
ncbi:MAG: HesA/MoeB/ThiF family protein [Litoreibacter sp.]|nr:HesA/MoeB/ThiF family protein [Litoreibacter sp.]